MDSSTTLPIPTSSISTNSTTNPNTQTFTLPPEHELRFEIPSEVHTATLTLHSGSAELNGISLALNRPYILSPSLNAAAFTWHGATLHLHAPSSVMAYTATDTPMPSYISSHAILQSRRQLARSTGIPGPRAVIVGPRDCGKTTLVNTLAAYSVRANGSAIVVDTDPSSGGVAAPLPASFAISAIQHLDLDDGGLVHERLTSLMVGHTSPLDNISVTKRMFKSLGSLLDQVLSTQDLSPHVGCLIDTSAEVDGKDGLDVLESVVKSLHADVVFVLGAERLYAALRAALQGGTTEVVSLGKSGGVVSRDDRTRLQMQALKIKHYFYGPENRLSPFSMVVNFDEITVLAVGGKNVAAPLSALPVGSESSIDLTKPQVVKEFPILLNKVLAVSQAEKEEEVMTMPVFGYVHVVKVDIERSCMTLLAPSAEKIPGKFLLAGDTTWIE